MGIIYISIYILRLLLCTTNLPIKDIYILQDKNLKLDLSYEQNSDTSYIVTCKLTNIANEDLFINRKDNIQKSFVKVNDSTFYYYLSIGVYQKKYNMPSGYVYLQKLDAYCIYHIYDTLVLSKSNNHVNFDVSFDYITKNNIIQNKINLELFNENNNTLFILPFDTYKKYNKYSNMKFSLKI